MPGPGSHAVPKPDSRARQRYSRREIKAALWQALVKLDVLEFGEFIERWRQWAAEALDVVIPDPVETV